MADEEKRPGAQSCEVEVGAALFERFCERCGQPANPRRRFCSKSCAARATPKRRAPVESRFWSKVRKDGPTVRPELGPCWEWTAGLFRTGYGAVKVRESGRWVRRSAHRISYQLAHGEVSADLVVMHRCDNRRCVRPEHLELGTTADNIHDRDQKLRGTHGEGSHYAKLTDAAVLEIRERYASTGIRQKDLAKEYGVSGGTIAQVVTGRKWKHLLPPGFVHVSQRGRRAALRRRLGLGSAAAQGEA